MAREDYYDQKGLCSLTQFIFKKKLSKHSFTFKLLRLGTIGNIKETTVHSDG